MNKSWIVVLAALVVASGSLVYLRNSSSSVANGIADEMLGKLKRAYPSFAADQYNNASLILNYAVSIGVTDLGQLSYVLSTAIGESGIRPIKEIRCAEGTACWKAQNAYWYTGYYGRGFVQLTWQSNYQKFGAALKIDLVGNPDLALNPTYAAQIMSLGM